LGYSERETERNCYDYAALFVLVFLTLALLAASSPPYHSILKFLLFLGCFFCLVVAFFFVVVCCTRCLFFFFGFHFWCIVLKRSEYSEVLKAASQILLSQRDGFRHYAFLKTTCSTEDVSHMMNRERFKR